MPKSSGARLLGLLAVAAGGVLALFWPAFPADSRKPNWWDLSLVVRAKGTYQMKDGRAIYEGHYVFSASWFGSLETDGSDFLLYQGGAEVLEWRASENVRAPDGSVISAICEFPWKPDLRVNYILPHGQALNIDFIIDGYPVPLADSAEKFNLIFPSSAENGQRFSEEAEYNFYITKGSNRVALSRNDIGGKPAQKSFRWSWLRQRGWLKDDLSLFALNRHDAEVVLTVKPRI